MVMITLYAKQFILKYFILFDSRINGIVFFLNAIYYFVCSASLQLRMDFLQVVASRSYSLLESTLVVSSYSLQLQCAGFSLWFLLLQSMCSRSMGSVQLWYGDQLSCSMWNPPRPGIEPVSLALAGIFLTTGPPGKSWNCCLNFLSRFFISSVCWQPFYQPEQSHGQN